MKRQQGVSLSGLLIVCVILIFLALLGFKVGPPYMEFLNIKKNVRAMIESGELRNATVNDVRKAFDRRAVIDDVSSISGMDLEIGKEGEEIVIQYAYPKKIHLFNNVSLLFDFAGSSKR